MIECERARSHLLMSRTDNNIIVCEIMVDYCLLRTRYMRDTRIYSVFHIVGFDYIQLKQLFDSHALIENIKE